MLENKVKRMWEAGEPVVNGWLHINSTWSAEVMSHQGFDSLVVDMQHGMMAFETALSMIQVIGANGTTPLARVTWNDPIQIMRLLDAGAQGIVCPMINTKAECEAFVAACLYHPDGYRSLGPTRPKLVYGGDYATVANKEILVIAMIETAEAVSNLDEILSVPGLDAIYVGTGDLALTYGSSDRVDYTDPDMLAVIDQILDGCERHGIIPGIHNSTPEYAQQMIKRGFKFVTIHTDSGLLSRAAKQAVNLVKEIDDEPQEKSGY